jgi:tRNA (guanine37-N1)-methyltransferase
MKITILTLFPDMFSGFLSESIIGRAQKEKIVEIETVDLRKWGIGTHKTVDDTPYGGGVGMVLRVDVVATALKDIRKKAKGKKQKVILLTPQGEKYHQKTARALSDKKTDLILVCGHYEGFDERIRDYVDTEISIGDYILTGGEIAAAVLADSIVRLLPGVLGKEESHQNESFESVTLEHPHYTRPDDFEGKKVPEVLTSGHHAEISKWRREEAIKRTKKRRPDLL